MSLPRYPEYKDSGVEWLGEVPEHWDTWKVAHGFECIGSGTTPPSDDSAWYLEGSIPWVTTSELRESVILDTSKSVTTFAIQKFSALKLHPAGSLVMAMYGATIGRLGILGVDATTNQACCVLSRPVSFDVKFVYYWLLGFKTNIIELFATGGGQPNISKETVASLRIPAPALVEQVSIAAFLDRETGKIDVLIAEQEKLLTLLAEKRQATISHAVTKGLSPDAPMKDSGVKWLGEVPRHWRTCPLKLLGRIGNGSTPSRDNPDYWAEEGFPWLNSSVVNHDEVTEAQQFVTPLALKECHLPIVVPPALLVGITGQGKTRGMATRLAFTATVNQHVAYIKPDESTLASPYLLCVLESAYKHLRTESDGAGSTKGAITCEQLGRLRIPLPPIAEQHAISAFLDTETTKLDSLKLESERAIALLKERRTALISAAVTGKIDVRREAAQPIVPPCL